MLTLLINTRLKESDLTLPVDDVRIIYKDNILGRSSSVHVTNISLLEQDEQTDTCVHVSGQQSFYDVITRWIIDQNCCVILK